MDPMIYDVRHLRRLGEAATPELVRADAEAYLGRQLKRREDHLDVTVNAYVNDSRWVADCPGCNGGIMLLVGSNEGTCLGCGQTYSVKWPTKKLMQAALPVLLARAESKNRNWFPWAETDADLKAENITRGIPLK